MLRSFAPRWEPDGKILSQKREPGEEDRNHGLEPDTKYMSVFISDGNRLCSSDCKASLTLAELLKRRQYNWLRGSLRVNGQRIPDSSVYETLETLQNETTKGQPWTDHMRVTCTTPADDPLKRPVVRPKRREESDDVRQSVLAGRSGHNPG